MFALVFEVGTNWQRLAKVLFDGVRIVWSSQASIHGHWTFFKNFVI